MVKIPTLGPSSTARVRPALSRDTASVTSPGKLQNANSSASLAAPPLAIQVKAKKKKSAPSMHKTISKAMLAGI